VSNPFADERWEHDSRHLFYLPRDDFRRLQRPKPAYLVGTRGTGKTTLLKALHWEERLSNRSLQRALRSLGDSDDLFAEHCVGVYFKLPRVQLELFDAFVGPDDPLYSNLVAFYLSLNWVDLLAEATLGLLDADVLEFGSEAEWATVRALCEEFGDAPLVERYLGPRETRTLRSLCKGVRRMRRHLERDLQTGATAAQLAADFPIGQRAEFAEVFARALVDLYPHDEGEEPWFFLVCMDEGESLTASQRSAISGLIRFAERPLLPVVAYLTMPEPIAETGGRAKTTRADVDTIRLDKMEMEPFKRFVEGVASVRIREATGDEEATIDLTRLLGRLRINELLEAIIKDSTSRWGRALLAGAETLRGDPYFAEKDTDAAPIYQRYLIDTLGLTPPQEDAEAWERRGQSASELRKWNATAYLSICRRMRTGPVYATAEMLLQLSDQCIRDFLTQMVEIYDEVGTTPARFAQRETIPIETQNKALRRASDQKMGRIADAVLAETTTAERLVDGLGRLTAWLQNPSEAQLEAGYVQHLRSHQPGVFGFRAGVPRDKLEDMIEVIGEAIEANYLRLVRAGREGFRFRVHTSLAPHFGFAYRGAYAETLLDLDEVRQVCEERDSEGRNTLIERIATGLIRAGDPRGTIPLWRPSGGEE
jgi:hypothetical protein